jgi:hypothetical protein
MNVLRHIYSDCSGTTAAEFALVLPAALLLLLGAIDVGRYAWELNEYEKATQMGARYAIATNVAANGLKTESYVGNANCPPSSSLGAGDRICAAALSKTTCTVGNGDCACSGNCLTDRTRNLTAMQMIVSRMRVFAPQIRDTAVEVIYRGSGLGYAGDPDKPEIAPFVTVRVAGAKYRPIILSPFGTTVNLPDFNYTLTLEDGVGTLAN